MAFIEQGKHKILFLYVVLLHYFMGKNEQRYYLLYKFIRLRLREQVNNLFII